METGDPDDSSEPGEQRDATDRTPTLPEPVPNTEPPSGEPDPNPPARGDTAAREQGVHRISLNRRLTGGYNLDGKPGHDAQSKGLLQALAQRRAVQAYEIPLTQHDRIGLSALLQRRFPPAVDLPAPTLLLGAGHATHWPML